MRYVCRLAGGSLKIRLRHGSSACLAALLIATCARAEATPPEPASSAFPVLRGSYLGQPPPGLTAEPFAPAVLSIPGTNHHTLSFSADGKELYFSRYPERSTVVFSADGEQLRFPRYREHVTLVMREVDGQWTSPQPAPWKGWEAILSPDGKQVVFGNGALWMAARGPQGWEPRKLPPPVSCGKQESRASMTANGTLYFSRLDDSGHAKIFRSRPEAGEYRRIEAVLDNASDPFISPDESYVIFSAANRSGGRGGADLYVAFTRGDGSFSEPVNLGPKINSPDADIDPVVSPDGKYLIFTRLRGGTGQPFWVNTDILVPLRAAANCGQPRAASSQARAESKPDASRQELKLTN